jgi:hypothetical protein
MIGTYTMLGALPAGKRAGHFHLSAATTRRHRLINLRTTPFVGYHSSRECAQKAIGSTKIDMCAIVAHSVFSRTSLRGSLPCL